MRRAIAAAAAASCALAGFAVLTATPSSAAAPAACTASDDAIYTPPAVIGGAPGDVLACRQVTLVHVPGNIPMKAFKVQYRTTDNLGRPAVATGTVAVPNAAWTGGGSRPVVSFHPGTLGIGPQCAFSKQLAGAYQDMYEGDNLAAILKAGMAFAATDGIGYTKGSLHPYVNGLNAGHSMLDMARASLQVPGAGLTAGTKIGLWGYSEGGHSSLWAAQLAKSYAPDLNVVGAAAGGVPGDLKLVGEQLNGGPFFGFLADAVVGLTASYPTLEPVVNSLLNKKGKDALALTKTQCLFGTLLNFLFAKVEDYSDSKLTLKQLFEVRGTDGVTVGQRLDEQKLGVGIGKPGSGAKYEIGFPVYQYRGIFEEIINTKATDATRKAYCDAGISTKWDSWYPSEHLTTDILAISNSVKWLDERFRGAWHFGNC